MKNLVLKFKEKGDLKWLMGKCALVNKNSVDFGQESIKKQK